jgi:hypothetical protein
MKIPAVLLIILSSHVKQCYSLAHITNYRYLCIVERQQKHYSLLKFIIMIYSNNFYRLHELVSQNKATKKQYDEYCRLVELYNDGFLH